MERDQVARIIGSFGKCLEMECRNECTECEVEQYSKAEIMKAFPAAVEYLKPRVLTLDEAVSRPVCWIEIPGSLYIDPAPCSPRLIYDEWEEEEMLQICYFTGQTFVGADRLGKDFRLWSEKPGEAQREATPWTEDENEAAAIEGADRGGEAGDSAQ